MRTTSLRIARAVLLALVVPAATAAAQSGSLDRRVGLITHEMDPASVTLLRDANVRHVKTTLYWHLWVGDPTYPTSFREGIARLGAAGFEITVVVHSPPNTDTSYVDRSRVYDDFATFVAARAKELPAVRNWQLWNEQDAGDWTTVFGRGVVSSFEQGKNYAAMLNLATPRIKAANPKAQVVVGGLGGDSIAAFVRGIYAGGGAFDVMAIHAYGLTLWDAARARGTEIRAVMQANADRRPIWLTEFGIDSATMVRAYLMTTPAEWDARQRWEWSNVATGNDQARIYARLIGYVLYDGSDYGYGIVRSNKTTVRPTYTWLQQRDR